ncbi:MAG TPA: hypothetical protein VN673_10880, partial [Clostridia bacterium]|nr:hypothetical protein [Clostridia bacterium]
MKNLKINRAALITTLALPILLSACAGPQTLRIAQDPEGYGRLATSYRRVCFSPDGKRLAAGGIKVGWIKESCSVFVFDIDSGREVQH